MIGGLVNDAFSAEPPSSLWPFSELSLSMALIHAQDNMRGAPYNGYTGANPSTRAHYAYDYLVDSSLPQDDPAGKEVQDAAGGLRCCARRHAG